jgi:hypothetical protein
MRSGFGVWCAATKGTVRIPAKRRFAEGKSELSEEHHMIGEGHFLSDRPEKWKGAVAAYLSSQSEVNRWGC